MIAAVARRVSNPETPEAEAAIPATAKLNTSVPSPPVMTLPAVKVATTMSLPAPPSTLSPAPPPVVIVSLPSPPKSVSLPEPPVMMSLPAPPLMLEEESPIKVSELAEPVIDVTLAAAAPIVNAAVPVKPEALITLAVMMPVVAVVLKLLEPEMFSVVVPPVSAANVMVLAV